VAQLPVADSDTPIVRLRYRTPYDWGAMLAHLRARAIEGVEEVTDDAYRRTLSVGRQLGCLEVRHEAARGELTVVVRVPDLRAVASVETRLRRVFDIDVDIEAITAHLSCDPGLAPLVALRPGLRVPGGWDGFELAVRAILGQQVTVAAARQLAGRLVALCGPSLPKSRRLSAKLTHAFPSPERVAAADLDALGMPGARRATLKAMAEATLEDPDLFRSKGTIEGTVARFRAIRGVGEWTAQYIALRALREGDAFPASDIGLLRGAAIDGARPTPAQLLRLAERWRPWRAYAAQHLWVSDAATVDRSRVRPRLGKAR
jgi:AraC family transcriptional regulator, regulatory protein of adaptative response / DNA-3-methyladenine glycosylase II